MKKYAEKSLKVLEHVNNEIGIDISKYRNTEIIGKIKNLVMIQKYSISHLYKPVLFSLLLYALGFFIFSFELLGAIVYGILGFLLFVANGITFGIIRILSNLKKDLKFIINTSLDFTLNVCSDVIHLNSNIKNIESPIGLIFEGIVAAIVTPSLSSTFDKVPLLRGVLMYGSDKTLSIAVSQLKKQETKLGIKIFIHNRNDKMIAKSEMVQNFINSFKDKGDKVLDSGFSSVQIPLKIVFSISIIITCLFLIGCSIF